MSIGYDAKRLFCNFTGLGNYSRTLLENLAAFYPEQVYHLYTTKITDHPKTNFFIENEAYQTHLSDTHLKAYWRSYAIVNQLKKDGIELYHGLSHEIPFGIKKSGIKSIVTIHDLIFKHYPTTYSFFDRQLYDLKFKYSCKNAHKIVAISENTKKDIIRFYNIEPAKIEVLYQSCNPVFYQTIDEITVNEVTNKYNLPTEYLLFVGSIIKRKNLEVIINAYEHLENDCKIPLVILGSGKSYKKEMLQLIKRKGFGNLIVWLNNVQNDEDLAAIYSKAMALIYPSLYEGFGLPVAEALLCKTPVITSNISSLPEAGGSSSLFVNPTNAIEVAGAISKVLKDEGLRKTMQQSGYDYALNTFGAKKLSSQLMEIYSNILEA